MEPLRIAVSKPPDGHSRRSARRRKGEKVIAKASQLLTPNCFGVSSATERAALVRRIVREVCEGSRVFRDTLLRLVFCRRIHRRPNEEPKGYYSLLQDVMPRWGKLNRCPDDR